MSGMNEYLLFFVNQNIAPQSVIANGFDHDNGLMVFYIKERGNHVPIAGVNARAIANFVIEPYVEEGVTDPTGVHDPGPTLRDSDEGWDESLISPGNPFVRSLRVEEPEKGPVDLRKPKDDPFRGGKLKEKR